MTLDQCQSALTAIRRRQGTRSPMIRVECQGSRYQGRLVRSDSDPENRHDPRSPFGTITLASPGLFSEREVVLQIANIADGGVQDHQDESAVAEARVAVSSA